MVTRKIYKRKRKQVRRNVKRGKTFRPGLISNPYQHKFVTAYSTALIHTLNMPGTSTGIATGFGALDFKLSYLPNTVDLGTSYDQFRIDWVQIDVFPHFAQSIVPTIASGQSAGILVMHSFSDYDDTTVPTTLDSVIQRPNCKSSVVGDGRWYTYKLRPRASIASATGTSQIMFAKRDRPVIDMVNQSLTHHGWKYALTMSYNNPPGTAADIKIELLTKITYHYTCFNPR